MATSSQPLQIMVYQRYVLLTDAITNGRRFAVLKFQLREEVMMRRTFENSQSATAQGKYSKNLCLKDVCSVGHNVV